MHRLSVLGFVGVRPGPLGDLSYAVIYNPYYIIKRAYLAGKVHRNKWQALAIRANEVSAFDLEDVDDEGRLIVAEDDNNDEAEKPMRRSKSPAKAAKPQFMGRRAKRN